MNFQPAEVMSILAGKDDLDVSLSFSAQPLCQYPPIKVQWGQQRDVQINGLCSWEAPLHPVHTHIFNVTAQPIKLLNIGQGFRGGALGAAFPPRRRLLPGVDGRPPPAAL